MLFPSPCFLSLKTSLSHTRTEPLIADPPILILPLLHPPCLLDSTRGPDGRPRDLIASPRVRLRCRGPGIQQRQRLLASILFSLPEKSLAHFLANASADRRRHPGTEWPPSRSYGRQGTREREHRTHGVRVRTWQVHAAHGLWRCVPRLQDLLQTRDLWLLQELFRSVSAVHDLPCLHS